MDASPCPRRCIPSPNLGRIFFAANATVILCRAAGLGFSRPRLFSDRIRRLMSKSVQPTERINNMCVSNMNFIVSLNRLFGLN
jgi:hypothetical protein